MTKSKDMTKSKLANKHKILMNINITLRLCFDNSKTNKQKLKKTFLRKDWQEDTETQQNKSYILIESFFYVLIAYSCFISF